MAGDESLKKHIAYRQSVDKIYRSTKLLDEETVTEMCDDFLSDSFSKRQSAVVINQGTKDVEGIYHDWRTSKTFQGVSTVFYSDFCEQLEDWVGDGTKVNQLDILLYERGDKFDIHQDTLLDEPQQRIWSTTTVLHLSDDYVGHGLVIYDSNGEDDPKGNPEIQKFVPRQHVGDTIIFKSDQWHEVKPIEQGTRIVAVAWLGYK
jgi:hypothetical protein